MDPEVPRRLIGGVAVTVIDVSAVTLTDPTGLDEGVSRGITLGTTLLLLRLGIIAFLSRLSAFCIREGLL